MAVPSDDKPVRLLITWGAQDTEFLRDAFFDRPEFEIELVTGDRSSGPSPDAMRWGRFGQLVRRLKQGEFDLLVSNNVFHTAWPTHKSLPTRLAVWLRFATYKRGMLDSYWAPWLVRASGGRVPHAVVDLRDPCFVLPNDLDALESCTLYFKRELFFNPSRSLLPLSLYFGDKRILPLGPKIRNLSYAANAFRLGQECAPWEGRDIDLFISGQGNVLRDDVRERVRKLGERYNVRVVETPISDEEYEDCLRRTKLVVCVESFGCETWRQYDAAAYGAVPLLNWPFTRNRDAMLPGEHAIYFSYLGDHFEQTVHAALADTEKLKRISAAAHRFVNEVKDRKRLADAIVSETLAAHSISREI